MRVYLGSDHAGLAVKERLLSELAASGHEPIDCGPQTYVDTDDYPPYCLRTGAAVVADPGSLGVVLGGSGNGEQIAANKVVGVRAALAWNVETARLARLHNDANVLSVGARLHPVDQIIGFVQVFLTTEFSGEERHARRIAQLHDYESTGRIPQVP